MDAFDRFLRTLKSEFKRGACRHIRSLWADLEELAEAAGESARAAIVMQALRRVCILERAARAANAHEVQAVSERLKRALANGPESFVMLELTMARLTEALHAIDTEAPASDRIERSPVAELVESHAD
jgi:hypothetical protein